MFEGLPCRAAVPKSAAETARPGVAKPGRKCPLPSKLQMFDEPLPPKKRICFPDAVLMLRLLRPDVPLPPAEVSM